MVEAASQAMNGVPDNQREFQWKRFLKDKDANSGLRVLITNEKVWVGFSKDSDPILKILNVVLGPFDFRPNT